ncbi:MAG: xanthine dehydrogenase family protein subunit M [Rhodobacterales bacterium]
MYETKYHKASSVSEAASLMGASDDGKLLAGGQTLIPTMKAHLAAPSDLVDVSAISEMNGIGIVGDRVTIGAATTHADVAGDAALQEVCAAVADLAAGIGDPAVRHKGTLGGSIANNDPAADYPAALLALGATIKTNAREITAEDFFAGLFETALDDNEVIVSVSFDAPEKACYAKFPNPASRYAMAGVFAAQTANGARVAVTGAGDDGVYRQFDAEAALDDDWNADALSGVTFSPEGMLSDMHGDATYRANLVKVMAGRAVAGC